MQSRILARASEKKDQLCSMFRRYLDDGNFRALGGKISIVTAHAKIKECLGLDQARDSRLLLVLLLHWSILDTGYLPAVAIFRMLRLVSIETHFRGQVRYLLYENLTVVTVLVGNTFTVLLCSGAEEESACSGACTEAEQSR